MGFSRGPKATIVTSDLVYSVTTTGGTIMSQGDTGLKGGYTITFRHDLFGCGGPDSGILILLKDDFPWTRMAFDWEGNGTASCWNFMPPTGGYGAATGTVNGNMTTFDSVNQDAIIRPYLTWEVPAYQSHNRFFGCNTNADNFFRFNASEYKKFRMLRTRNTSGNLAGIHHGRSCNSTGAFTIIKNIFIW